MCYISSAVSHFEPSRSFNGQAPEVDGSVHVQEQVSYLKNYLTWKALVEMIPKNLVFPHVQAASWIVESLDILSYREEVLSRVLPESSPLRSDARAALDTTACVS